VRDSSGFVAEPLYFYFKEGTHTIRLTAVQEPMAIERLYLTQYEKPVSYEEYKKANSSKTDEAQKAEPIKIQGENSFLKSDAMISPISDRSSCATEPNDVTKLKLNCIGGSNWQQSGQWIIWELDVKKSGIYNIGIKGLQNFYVGSTSHRRMYIDEKVPFSEVDDISFLYDGKWNMNVLGSEKPYEFYLEEGRHTLKLEVSQGGTADYLKEASDILTSLNKIYREILMLTGPVPDLKRDYQFNLAIPDTIEDMKLQSKRLRTLYNVIAGQDKINAANGQSLFQLYTQIDSMTEKLDLIANKFNSFQGNINALGAWINEMKNQPLSIDYISVIPKNSEMPKPGKGTLAEMAYQIKGFFASFFVDYNEISYGKLQKSVSVWVGSGVTGGRDQAQIIKNLADNYFTPQKGISAELQLVSMGALLPATLSGKGPDVALSLSSGEAANYAFRGAAVDMSEFSDYGEVEKRFYESALEPLAFEEKIFGLPETQTFPMMFYRKDILTELGIGIPDTWQDVIDVLPVLQKKQLDFGLPAVGTPGSTISMFTMLLYQNGGELYSKNGDSAQITTDSAFNAFSFFTSLYTDYSLPVQIDFINRFRMGSVPIGIADYSVYNQLSVFAPEINGLWGFISVPGIMNENGEVNRTVAGSVSASVILQKAKNKDYAWEFVKWWTDADIQVQFGRQLESVMGVAARYPTANIEASRNIPWSKENYDALLEQWATVKGIPEVPGSYFTPRNIDFAFRSAVYDFKDIDDCLTAASKSINAEINKKRKEFGLSLYNAE